MNKIIVTKGLPASGKSTWSREYQEKNPNTVRVNKDDLRVMLHNGVWSNGREDFVLKVRNFIVEEALKAGHDVILDDTNLHPKHKIHMEQIAQSLKDKKIEIEEKEFLDVSVEECIKRDLKRPNSVGEKVIRSMYKQFIVPQGLITQDETKPRAVIFDIDGTLALFGNKNPYDRDFENDTVNKSVAEVLKGLVYLPYGPAIIIVSGRNNKHQRVTEKWLTGNNIVYSKLYMRADGDVRKDSIVKMEILEEIMKDYFVNFVVDDRPQVCRMWRELGFPVFQVGDPDVEF